MVQVSWEIFRLGGLYCIHHNDTSTLALGQERQISRVWFILFILRKVAGLFLPLVVTYSVNDRDAPDGLPVITPAAWFINRSAFSLKLLIQGWIISAL